MVAKEHEHRNEDRSEDGPLGRAARNKDVDEGRNEDKGDAHGQARKADSFEEVSPGNRHERAQMGPVEKSLELTAEEAENNVGAHTAHLLDHSFIDILDGFEATRRDAIGDAGNTEEEEKNRNEAFEEQRTDEGVPVFGKNACKETDGKDGNIDYNGKTGTMKALYFKGCHFLNGLVFIFAVIHRESRFHNLG